MGDNPLRPPTDRRLGEPLPHQLANRTHAYPAPKFFQNKEMPPRMLWGINPDFSGLSPSAGQVPYVLRTRAPVAGDVLLHPAAPRLACVKPAASVHPEPGSNSPL